MAWAASVQRAHVYKPGLQPGTDEARVFRREVLEFVASTLLPKYKDGLAGAAHYDNIDCLIDFASNRGGKVLDKGGYKYGAAQKLLNLSLKYHWCLGSIPEPPHCPVDRIVIEKTKFRGRMNWTEIVTRPEYQKVIQAIAALAKGAGLSIARWELENYSRR